MPQLLATITLKHKSGFPEDDIVNSFAIDADPQWDNTAIGEISIPLFNFYFTDTTQAARRVADNLGPGLVRGPGGAVCDIYDITGKLDGSPHGSPVATDVKDTTPSRAEPAAGLPEEVALKVTFRAENYDLQPVERADGVDPGAEVDRPRQRYTGGFYLGPLATGWSYTNANKVRPTPLYITDTLNAAERLVDELAAFGHWLGVWSRSDASLRRVSKVEIDDAFDTQRRRGVAPTVRNARTVYP